MLRLGASRLLALLGRLASRSGLRLRLLTLALFRRGSALLLLLLLTLLGRVATLCRCAFALLLLSLTAGLGALRLLLTLRFGTLADLRLALGLLTFDLCLALRLLSLAELLLPLRLLAFDLRLPLRLLAILLRIPTLLLLRLTRFGLPLALLGSTLRLHRLGTITLLLANGVAPAGQRLALLPLCIPPLLSNLLLASLDQEPLAFGIAPFLLGAAFDQRVVAVVARRRSDQRRPVTAEIARRPCIITPCLGLTEHALVAPMAVDAVGPRRMIALPRRILATSLLPAPTVLCQRPAALRPASRIDAATLALARQAIEVAPARIIAPGIVVARPPIIGKHLPIAVIDRNQATIVIAIAIIIIPHEIGFVRTGLIEIAAITVVDRFGKIDRVVTALPRPRFDIARVIIGIVRRGIADRIDECGGSIDIAIAVACVRDPTMRDRLRWSRQRLSGGRGDKRRRRRACLERQRLGQRRQRLVGQRELIFDRCRLLVAAG
ncbi:hypothetical protein FHS96_004372 [Sphingomonas zeicaulis]|uniref:hypothetical protein n=1 Tax=Sphingomonas zeicaulis TaxID=1632740 RepID=UPI003D1FAF1D